MAFFQPRRRIYDEPIELGPQARTWIAKHRGFASRELIESQVQYGQWIPEKAQPEKYLIYTTVIDGIKPLTILIKIRKLTTYTIVYHVHVFKKQINNSQIAKVPKKQSTSLKVVKVTPCIGQTYSFTLHTVEHVSQPNIAQTLH